MRRSVLMLFLFAPVFLGVAGCAEEEKIRKEEVTFEDRQPMRIRVAIFQKEKLWWFLRISGPATLVKQHEADFDSFVRSVKFDDKKDPPIIVKEPGGWRKDPPGSKMRTMAFRIDAKPKELEVTVIKLDAKEQSLLNNVRRWEKEVHIAQSEAVEEAEGKQHLKRDKIGDEVVWWSTVEGVGVHTVSKPPDPHALDKKVAAGMNIRKADGSFPFTYEVPAGWTKQGPRVKGGIKTHEVIDVGGNTELTLSTAMGAVGENIDRWNGIIGLPKVGAAEAMGQAKRRKITGITAYYVDLANPKGDRILGLIIPMGAEKWFVKMTGPHDYVGGQKAKFESFIDSFKR